MISLDLVSFLCAVKTTMTLIAGITTTRLLTFCDFSVILQDAKSSQSNYQGPLEGGFGMPDRLRCVAVCHSDKTTTKSSDSNIFFRDHFE
jgi:hypothetical protein